MRKPFECSSYRTAPVCRLLCSNVCRFCRTVLREGSNKRLDFDTQVVGVCVIQLSVRRPWTRSWAVKERQSTGSALLQGSFTPIYPDKTCRLSPASSVVTASVLSLTSELRVQSNILFPVCYGMSLGSEAIGHRAAFQGTLRRRISTYFIVHSSFLLLNLTKRLPAVTRLLC